MRDNQGNDMYAAFLTFIAAAEPLHGNTQSLRQHFQLTVTDMALIFLNSGNDQRCDIHAHQIYFPGQIFLSQGWLLHCSCQAYPVTAYIAFYQKHLF